MNTKVNTTLLKDIRNATPDEVVSELNLPKFRGNQIFGWIRDGVTSFSDMTNLSKELRKRLSERYYLENYRILERQDSTDGTSKVLGALSDGSLIESVLMKHKYGYSACVSTQVGCKMGCTFCASAVGGFHRNLTAGEMLGQVYELTRIAHPKGDSKLSNLVLMGMGEPLDNYENVLTFIRRLTDETYYGMSARSVTLSTSGIVPKIKQLAEEGIPITLAVSLHNPFQKLREQIMPVAKRYGIEELMDAAEYYGGKTGRRVTLEYALIKGVNDSKECAEELSRLVLERKRAFFHVNLIPLNVHEDTAHKGVDMSSVRAFSNILSTNGVNVTTRRSLGSDIDAACGQLKNKWRKHG